MSAVIHAVAKMRRELVGKPADVAVRQTHAPGAEAEVDFGEFNCRRIRASVLQIVGHRLADLGGQR
ncbi:hypothetical protein BJ994_003547 [Arthrobacter pigmenti]|uniref:Uncharacterized protein n=1 Tax=Arthrobacter pigmenti TaxID=271432 RepID=A0A846S214_9MICC|nr:hypothetical protein [Arthrobacter pigmenti]NJC24471.1 hypothetical protein [Arthrobacter pigmenti]